MQYNNSIFNIIRWTPVLGSQNLNGITPSLDPVSLGVDGGVRHLIGRRKIK